MKKSQSKVNNWWARHLPREEQNNFKEYVINSTELLQRLDDILLEMEEKLYEDMSNKDSYDSPSWACLQAHRNGELAAIKRLTKLTDHVR